MGIIGSVFNGIGNLISGGTWSQSGSQVAQQKFNAKEAQKQRDFEERMSNTAIQRQVADAKAAGINPAMMFANSSASGASTPNGSSAHSASSSAAGDSLSSVLNSASNLARAFNHDKEPSNNLSLKDVATTAAKIATLIK